MDYDIIIVGGGPAGLVCGQYAARAGQKVAIFEEMACGGQTIIIDEIENYPALGKISGYELGSLMEEQATRFGCEFVYCTVNSVKGSKKEGFTVNTSSGDFTCRAVVIATGAKHRNLGVPGEKELTGHGVSYCATCDGPFFKGKNILVCGGGDSACQEALYLSKLSEFVTICHRRDKFRAQDAIVKKVQDSNIKTKMNEVVVSINGKDGKVCSVTLKKNSDGSIYTQEFDAVFIFAGSIPQTNVCPQCDKDESGFIKTDSCMMTNIDGLYAVGDVRNTPFRQIVTAASDGAIAAHHASEHIEK